MTQDERRARRTNIHTIGALVMLAFLGWIIYKLDGGALQSIGLGLVAILAVREMFHGAENVTARIKGNAGPTGVGFEVTPQSPDISDRQY